jgi:WD40 repeat protein
MLRTCWKAAAGILACATTYTLTAATVRAPVAGYVYDPAAQALRPIEGIPGAALVGGIVDAGVPLAAAEVAGDQNFAVAVDAESGDVLLLALNGGAPSPTRLFGRLSDGSGAPRIVLSESGRSAAVIDGTWAQIVTGLPGRPTVTRVLHDDGLSSMSAFALSDDGELLLAAGETVRLYVDGSGRDLSFTGPIGAVAFRRGSHDAVIAASGAVTVVENIDTGGLYQGFDAGGGIVGIAFLGTSQLLAASSDGSVTVYDRATYSARTVNCHCTVNGLARMNNTRVFRLTDSVNSPLMIVDASQPDPALFFVPRQQQ